MLVYNVQLLHSCCWKRETYIFTGTWTHWTQDDPGLFKKCDGFFEIIVQLGLDQRDMLEDYWSTLDKHFTAFYCNILKQDRLYRVLRFLHFSDNKNEHDKTDVNWTDCGKWQLSLTS